MKKLVLILICTILFLSTGCNKDGYKIERRKLQDIDITEIGLSEADKKIPQIFGAVDDLNIIHVEVNNSDKYFYLLKWQEYNQKKFYIEIYNSYTSKEKNS